MSKIYILDTNVLLHDPKSLFSFADNEVVIPLVVLDELDRKKDGHTEVARHARMVIRSLDDMRLLGKLDEGVGTPAGGIVRVELNHQDNIPNQLDPSRADNRIISVVLGLKKDNSPSRKVALVTKDINLRVKCDALGVIAEDYNTDSVADNAEAIYSGVVEVTMSDDDIDTLNDTGYLDVPAVNNYHANEYVLLRSDDTPKKNGMARFVGDRLVKIEPHSEVWGIQPRNKEQVFAFDALFDPNISLVTMIGKAGSGKTLAAVATGLSQVFDSNTYRKLIITRPVVPLGKEIGFLPGNIREKMEPWMAPLWDNLELLCSGKGVGYLEMEQGAGGKLEVEALTYIRGRSIPKTFIIVDECLTEGHMISMADGTLKDVKDVAVGDIVFSTDINSYRLSKAVVGGVIERGADEIYDIETSISTLHCTPNHPLYVFNGGFKKIEAQDISVGDFIPVPRKVPHVSSTDVDNAAAYFLGMILSDGNISDDYKTIEVAVSEDIEHFEHRIINGIMAIVKQDEWWRLYHRQGDYTICLDRKSIVEKICPDYGIVAGKEAKVRVPEMIFKSNISTIKTFISALFDTEGDIDITKGGELVVNYTTASLCMAKDVQHMLKKFGIVARRIDYMHELNNEIRHRIYLTGIDAHIFYQNIGFCMKRKQDIMESYFVNNKPLDKARIPVANMLRERLCPAGVENGNPLFKSIRSSKTIYRYMINSKYVEFFTQDELNFINNHNFADVKTVSKKSQSCRVYDFSVPELGTFCADGILSSNCQNLTRHEVKTIITRVGENSKVILTGDIQQIDNAYIDAVDNGLSYVIEKFKDEPLAAHITLQKGERSELATLAAELL